MAYTAFDRFVASCRFRVAERFIEPGSRVCDLGCGEDAPFLVHLGPKVSSGVGLDVNPGRSRTPRIVCRQADILGALPLESGAFDHVTMLAVLEHLPQPGVTLREVYRILRPGGSLIATWPSAAVDPILEVVARLGLVHRDMGFDQHQPRISRGAFREVLAGIGFDPVRFGRFELGLNNWVVARRRAAASGELRPRPTERTV